MGVHCKAVAKTPNTRTLAARLADQMVRTVYATGKDLDDVVATVTAGDIRYMTGRNVSDVDVQVIKHIAANLASQQIA